MSVNIFQDGTLNFLNWLNVMSELFAVGNLTQYAENKSLKCKLKHFGQVTNK